MKYKIGDKVLAKTQLIRCHILGTIKQSQGDKVLVDFDHPIKGNNHAWVLRSNLKTVKTIDHVEVKNNMLKAKSMNIIKGVKTK